MGKIIVFIPVELDEDVVREAGTRGTFPPVAIPGTALGNGSPAPQRTQAAEVPQQELDPWAEAAGSRQARDATLAGPTPAQPAASATSGSPAGPSGVRHVKDKNGVQTWTFPPGAPNCECGVPAGHVSALNASGKAYKAFRCAKRSGDEWRSKCDFNEWAR
jgi:hypothetical protein